MMLPRKIKDCGDIEKAIAIIGKYGDVRPSETVWSEKRLLNNIGIGEQDRKQTKGAWAWTHNTLR